MFVAKYWPNTLSPRIPAPASTIPASFVYLSTRFSSPGSTLPLVSVILTQCPLEHQLHHLATHRTHFPNTRHNINSRSQGLLPRAGGCHHRSMWTCHMSRVSMSGARQEVVSPHYATIGSLAQCHPLFILTSAPTLNKDHTPHFPAPKLCSDWGPSA